MACKCLQSLCVYKPEVAYMTMQYIDDIIMINIEKLEMLGQHK